MTHTHTQSPERLDADGRREPPLPADDPGIFDLDLRGLRHHWAARADLPPISAESMMGADRRAQALGYPELRLMEHAGTAVAAAVRALASDLERWGTGPIVVLCGPGNNGGDGYRRGPTARAARCRRSSSQSSPRTRGRTARLPPATGTASRRTSGITKVHLSVARDVAMFGQGIEKAAVLVDALLGTGVRGALREPVRSAVELINKARAARRSRRRRRHADRGRSLER